MLRNKNFYYDGTFELIILISSHISITTILFTPAQDF